MKTSRITALVLAALIVGLVAGNVVTGFAATDSAAGRGAVANCGLQLGRGMRDAGGRLADVVAKLTGLDADDIRAKRQAGTSLSDIAAEKGVKSSAVVDEAMKVRAQVLADRVADGTITQAQADAALDNMRARLTERVSSTDAGRGGRGRGLGGGACGGRGAGAGACAGGNCGAAVTQ